ncbi:unnamed protein product, partial [Closterium sp. NIES-54]
AKEPGPGGLEATLALASHPSALLTPKIAHLLSLLRLYSSQPSPTIVIFVERIVTAHSLSQLLRLLPLVAASLKADFVVGAGAAKIGISANQGGTAKHSRPDSAISRFRAGKQRGAWTYQRATQTTPPPPVPPPSPLPTPPSRSPSASLPLPAGQRAGGNERSRGEEGMDIPACHTVFVAHLNFLSPRMSRFSLQLNVLVANECSRGGHGHSGVPHSDPIRPHSQRCYSLPPRSRPASLSLPPRASPTQLNVLVATSAAEEGMDIPACHTVIRFDRIPNAATLCHLALALHLSLSLPVPPPHS